MAFGCAQWCDAGGGQGDSRLLDRDHCELPTPCSLGSNQFPVASSPSLVFQSSRKINSAVVFGRFQFKKFFFESFI